MDYYINIKENIFNKRHIKKLNIFCDTFIHKIEKIELLKNTKFIVKIINFKEMKEISKKYTKEVPKGLFYVKDMTIYIIDSYDFKELYDTCLHEVGHLIDYVLGINSGFNTFYTINNDISNIIIKESKHIDYVYINDPQEFFAQSFSECFRNTYSSLFLYDTRKMFKKFKILNI